MDILEIPEYETDLCRMADDGCPHDPQFVNPDHMKGRLILIKEDGSQYTIWYNNTMVGS